MPPSRAAAPNCEGRIIVSARKLRPDHQMKPRRVVFLFGLIGWLSVCFVCLWFVVVKLFSRPVRPFRASSGADARIATAQAVRHRFRSRSHSPSKCVLPSISCNTASSIGV